MAFALKVKRDFLKEQGNAQNFRHEDGAAFSKYLEFLTSEIHPSVSADPRKILFPPTAATGEFRRQSCSVSAHHSSLCHEKQQTLTG